jgi:hypothetical protein
MGIRPPHVTALTNVSGMPWSEPIADPLRMCLREPSRLAPQRATTGGTKRLDSKSEWRNPNQAATAGGAAGEL